jgi:hypothetical protein
MNGMFTNKRGLRDLDKHIRIANCIQEHGFDFVLVSETGRRDFPMRSLPSGVDFIWTSRPPYRQSGGLLRGCETNTTDVVASLGGDFHIKLYM